MTAITVKRTRIKRTQAEIIENAPGISLNNAILFQRKDFVMEVLLFATSRGNLSMAGVYGC
jgi:hypothetical protein